jgi:hypothetical protein
VTLTRIDEGTRFWRKVDAADCWEWTAARDRDGYGRFTGYDETGKRFSWYAHRWSYVHLVGPVAEALTLDHLCRNTACVNPDHLQPVTRGTNVLRGYGIPPTHAAKTHCAHGHPFDATNTAYSREGWRVCIQCRRAKGRRRHRRMKEITG